MTVTTGGPPALPFGGADVPLLVLPVLDVAAPVPWPGLVWAVPPPAPLPPGAPPPGPAGPDGAVARYDEPPTASPEAVPQPPPRPEPRPEPEPPPEPRPEPSGPGGAAGGAVQAATSSLEPQWRLVAGPPAPPVDRLDPAFWSGLVRSPAPDPQVVRAVVVMLAEFTDGTVGIYEPDGSQRLGGEGPDVLRPWHLPSRTADAVPAPEGS